MLMGAIPRLFMAVAQALGSDMGIAKELESMAIFRSPSEREREREIMQFDSLDTFRIKCVVLYCVRM